MAARRALLIVNPHSRRGTEARLAARTLLHRLGLRILDADPASPGVVAEVIRRTERGTDLVIVAGGDGTLNAAAAAARYPLPLGTANDLVRTLGIPDTLRSNTAGRAGVRTGGTGSSRRDGAPCCAMTARLPSARLPPIVRPQ